MNLPILKVFAFAASFLSLISAVALAQDRGEGNKVLKNATSQYSALASELIAAYQPPARIPGAHQPRVLLPPGLRPEHLEEKYRSAWEELLLARVKEPLDPKVANMGSRIYQALQSVADAKSVPVLAKAFRQTTVKEVDQHGVISVQEQILTALTLICSTESLDAIFASLDLADENYGDGEPEKVSGGWTLRERTFSAMVQPDNPGRSDLQKAAIERSKKWHSLLQAYDNPKLSQKNREFLDKVKSGSRLEE